MKRWLTIGAVFAALGAGVGSYFLPTSRTDAERREQNAYALCKLVVAELIDPSDKARYSERTAFVPEGPRTLTSVNTEVESYKAIMDFDWIKPIRSKHSVAACTVGFFRVGDGVGLKPTLIDVGINGRAASDVDMLRVRTMLLR